MKDFKDPKPVLETERPNVLREHIEGLDIGATVVELTASKALRENKVLRIDIADAAKWGSEEGARKLRERRSEGIGRELYRYIFSSGKYEVILGCSNTPSAVKARLQVGSEYGYAGYYCGFRNGEYGEHGTEKQEERVKKISRDVQEIYAESGTTIPLKDMPEHTVVVREDAISIPPLKESDISFRPSDTKLDATFRKWLLPTQGKNLPHTTYGILLNIREDQAPPKT